MFEQTVESTVLVMNVEHELEIFHMSVWQV